MPKSATAPQVVIAMLTYRRPECLARILPLLVEQARTLSPPARVLVVDNDPAASARTLVTELSHRAADYAVDYVHEPRPGIAAARNRALSEAHAADALAFIDDDELPTEHWLTLLVSSWQRWDCAAVSGPVVAQFDGPVPAWVAASGAFDRRRRQQGTLVAGAPTNNLLLDLRRVQALGLRFDERLGLSGGEDTKFSHQLSHRGGEIRWCDDAEVLEPVAADRLTRGWVLRRAYRAGTSWTQMELSLAGSARGRLRTRGSLLIRGVAKLALAAAQFGWGLVSGNLRHRARATCAMASYAGLLVGLTGYTFAEYGRKATSPPT